jgi:hypothetical protein
VTEQHAVHALVARRYPEAAQQIPVRAVEIGVLGRYRSAGHYSAAVSCLPVAPPSGVAREPLRAFGTGRVADGGSFAQALIIDGA